MSTWRSTPRTRAPWSGWRSCCANSGTAGTHAPTSVGTNCDAEVDAVLCLVYSVHLLVLVSE
eukprot:1704356-Prymnesium_polylepis.1